MAAFGNQLQPWEENQISTCDPLETSFHLFTSDRTLPLATAQTASALKRRHPPSPMTATALHDSSSLLAETLGLPQPAFRRTDTDGGGTPRSGAQPPNDPDMSNPMRRAAERPLDTVRRMSKVVDLTPVGVFHDVICTWQKLSAALTVRAQRSSRGRHVRDALALFADIQTDFYSEAAIADVSGRTVGAGITSDDKEADIVERALINNVARVATTAKQVVDLIGVSANKLLLS
ncbi:uncharacterized protein L203_101675 [Cryptococcus depauperatus CBS 7841]|uniref:Uncharacterized protein n=1 Tax=Cryptococcus depauperatus CBS 7841 TaxID=1295531 RepID=A0AAJ8JQD3_9TREE